MRMFLDSFLRILLSSVLLLCAFPVLLIAALYLWLEGGGGIIYRQTRIGKDQHPFTMYKLRTIRTNSVCGSENTGDIPKVSSVGRFLRLTKIDELPQLINVARGEMNIVGPRPLSEMAHNRYNSTIPFFDLRYRVLPGITGLSQVLDPRDEDRRFGLGCDLYYITHGSFMVKIRIIFATALSIIREIRQKESPGKLERWAGKESPDTREKRQVSF